MRYEVADAVGMDKPIPFRNLSRARQKARKLSRSGATYCVFHKGSESALFVFCEGRSSEPMGSTEIEDALRSIEFMMTPGDLEALFDY